MPFPFLGNYLWGHGKGIAQRHFQTAEREHQDLSEMARIMNNLSVEGGTIERNGDFWEIKMDTDQDPDDPNSVEDYMVFQMIGGKGVWGLVHATL